MMSLVYMCFFDCSQVHGIYFFISQAQPCTSVKICKRHLALLDLFGMKSKPLLLRDYCDAIDGRNLAPVDMLSISNYFSRVSYMSGGCLGFLNHQPFGIFL